MFVLFDSCWDPCLISARSILLFREYNNSGWVQSPGAAALADPSQVPRLMAYVQGVVAAFAKDDRILAWDVWNEPAADNLGSYAKQELKDKTGPLTALLPQVFRMGERSQSRAASHQRSLLRGHPRPTAPNLGEIAQIQLRESDVITFHNYSWPENFKQQVAWLKKYKPARDLYGIYARSRGQHIRHHTGLSPSRSASAPSTGIRRRQDARPICPG